MAVRHSNTLYSGAISFPPAYKYYKLAVEESRKLVASLDTDSSPLLPREIVEEERKAASRDLEQLKRDIKAKDERLHNAETKIRELQESGLPSRPSCTHFLKQPQNRCYVVTSKLRSTVPKL